MIQITDKDLRSIQEARNLIASAKEAFNVLKEFSQEKIDRIVEAMSEAAKREAKYLAKLAVEETKIGNYKDKILKNLFAAEKIYDFIKDMKTVGIINTDSSKRVIEIAEPVGIIVGIIPTTNPTSTAIFKALIAVKARNPIIFSPHPRATRCTSETVRIMEEAAEKAGAPKGTLSCLTITTMDATKELMTHPDTSLILATGGAGLVKAAYSAGKPAYGVGPGNVPVFVERTADLKKAARDIVNSKAFDNGVICASEQEIIVERAVADQLKKELEECGAYFLKTEEKRMVENLLSTPNWTLNTEVVGKSAVEIARMAGFSVPPSTKVLIGYETSVGKKYPFSWEKLCPVLGYYVEDDWQKACERAIEILKFSGIGHTLSIHSKNEKVIMEFALKKPAFRILINTASALGAIGGTTGLDPSLTLGCGTWGGNITADNVTPRHLINVKRVAYETVPFDLEAERSKFNSEDVAPVSPGSTTLENGENEVEKVLKEFLKKYGINV